MNKKQNNLSVSVTEEQKKKILDKTNEFGYDFVSGYLKALMGFDEYAKMKIPAGKNDKKIAELVAFAELFPYAIILNIEGAIKYLEGEKKKLYESVLVKYSMVYDRICEVNNQFIDTINVQGEKLDIGVDIVESFVAFVENHGSNKNKVKELVKFCKK